MFLNLSDKLRTSRKNANLSRKQVAERIGISYSVLAHYECGEREPSLNVIFSLARLYKVSIDYLLDNEQPNISIVSLDGLDSKQQQIIRDTITYFKNSTHN